VPEVLRQKLGHRMVPLGLVLSKSIEVFYETNDRVMPSKLFGAGSLVGLWEAFDPAPTEFLRSIWNLSAGARSIFMLPSISETSAHTRLKRDFGIASPPPNTLLDHNNVFIELTRRDNENQHWFCEVLFFADDWLENPRDNNAFLQLHHYLLSEAWKQSINGRNQMSYDVAWEIFSREVKQRNCKPKTNTINIIKHLMSVSAGIFPGFTPTGKDETAAPIKFIQDCYINSYQLKEYAPILIVPHHLRGLSIPVYYSLAFPTQLEYAPKNASTSTIIEDIRELKMLVDIFLNSQNDNIHHYDFYHSEDDQFGEIQHVSELPVSDPHLMVYPGEYGHRRFPENGAFWRGCIQVSKLDDTKAAASMVSYA
ncbi:MAG: hypothetical protein ACK4PR_01635, partial [Gammaproteobacteria bacterium]